MLNSGQNTMTSSTLVAGSGGLLTADSLELCFIVYSDVIGRRTRALALRKGVNI